MEVIRMEKGLKEEITIVCKDEKEQMDLGNHIHHQLRGNADYINNNIILNIDTENTIKLYVYEECKERPTITI